ncbi:MAG: aldolase/citrate lyase family protein [Gemmataceae bacterium]
MKTNSVKRQLKAGKPSLGTWLSLGSIPASRFMARAGFSWLTVDIEHTLVNIETATHMFASIADAGCVPLARVPSNRHDHIKRALDNGAMGVVVPMVNTVAEAKAAVSACLYPPRGDRSVGGSVHALNFGTSAAEYFQKADDELLIVLQCEHIMAVEDADAILAVPGIDAIFVGPNDLAASMRGPTGAPPSAEATAKAMAKVLAACKKNGVAAGVHCFSTADAQARIAEGWQFLAIGSELKMMVDGAAAVLAPFRETAGGDMAKY